MASVRLDVRLDGERRRKLQEIAAARGAPVSQVVRALIDQAYEEAQLEVEHHRAVFDQQVRVAVLADGD